MKKTFLLIICLFLSTWANRVHCQQALRALIQGEQGKSAHFTRLPNDKQIAFTPSQAKLSLGLDANSDLALMRSESDNIGEVHHRFQQIYKGIPIENSMYIMHTKNGKLTGMSGEI